MKFVIENFGCQMNDHDMERMSALLIDGGLTCIDDAQEADVIIVNTCCVREKAEQKFYSRMGRLKSIKAKKGTILGVTGCIAQLEKRSILDRIPFIDFALGPSNIHKINEAVERATKGIPSFDFTENGCSTTLLIKPINQNSGVKTSVTIMKGCNNFCSYCVVPYVRGRESSRESGEVLDEIRGFVAAGIKEVTLLGQNVNSYNKSSGDISFPELLRRINDIDGIERIRFVTSHPKDLSPDLIDCFGALDKLCEAIHLPFQSGSDKILELMNRGYTKNDYREKIAALRTRCKDMAITADCIVGFPGEDEKDFFDTMNLIEEVRFDNIFSFAYSPRKFTRAATLPGEVARDLAMERLHHFQDTQKAITIAKNRVMIGKKVEVLVEDISKNSEEELMGRTRTNKIVNFKGKRNLIKKLVEVEIIKGYANSLKGKNPNAKGGALC
ncbi:MAG: tRNA (N6-isopentenyl adenosine(37)-C2)-methylthiotransferase MiaB [Syntrophus sp. (in: bacteria)]|nr:tRNA (N6-isopentenyl adenosine(37)-C2)-methylthiotransferase MiaB [Syntrophus sp. (in: bacteria)]